VKNPFRTEAEAFSFVIVMGLLFGAVALAGVLGGRWVALGVFLALGLGIALGMYMKSEPKVREPAVWDRHRAGPGERKKILVVANETVAGRALRGEIVHRTKEADADVLVVCPALNSPLRHWTSDEDALRTFGADEIIISTHPPGRSNWLEKEVITHARERFDLPITHIVVDLEQERAET
jgi:hypothetical protein